VIHVYGFVAARSDAPPLAGVDDATVETYVVDSVAAVISRHPDGPAATQEAVVRHAQVVEAAMRTAGTVLPARFGAAYADDASLGRAVSERAPSLRDRLGRVEGCVELGVRVLAPDEASASAADGGAYMRSRLRETREREGLAARIHRALDEIAQQSTTRVPHAGRALLIGSYLVEAARQDEFRRQVEQLGRECSDLALVCTGPWPPYSFADVA
jgi:Gas vesicle synthesis protein GvpL/GvpF